MHIKYKKIIFLKKTDCNLPLASTFCSKARMTAAARSGQSNGGRAPHRSMEGISSVGVWYVRQAGQVLLHLPLHWPNLGKKVYILYYINVTRPKCLNKQTRTATTRTTTTESVEQLRHLHHSTQDVDKEINHQVTLVSKIKRRVEEKRHVSSWQGRKSRLLFPSSSLFPSFVRFPLYQHMYTLDPDSYPNKTKHCIYIYVYEYIYLICNLSLLFFVEV